MRPIERFIERLPHPPRRSGKGYVARCSTHEDRTPSMSFREGDDGRVLLHCHAGCTAAEIVAAIGLELSDLYPDGDRPRRHARRDHASPRQRNPRPVREAKSSPSRDWSGEGRAARRALTRERRDALAAVLGVTPAALDAVELGWHDARGAYTFPERDGCGMVVGIALRYIRGHKSFIAGGHRGLVIPAGLHDLPDPVLIVEGASDVAACLTHGIAAVGRPSAAQGARHLAPLLRDRDVLVVGENDRKSDGRWPGREGAIRVAQELASAWGRTVRRALPPAGAKDVREWLEARAVRTAGGAQ